MSHVLLVEDDPVIRAMGSALLESAGHCVIEAETGARALLLLREVKFDVLITDVCMPGMNGLELIQTIRAAGSGIRIVALSGGSQVLRSAKAFGADLVLQKPVAPSALLAALETGS
ncbi:MAG TPA: response regulator [Aliidongia sp.]|nr:response regulator [Aliidongia sp.]